MTLLKEDRRDNKGETFKVKTLEETRTLTDSIDVFPSLGVITSVGD